MGWILQWRDSDDGVSAKKARVVWSVEMHQQFVQAVNQLGIDSELHSFTPCCFSLHSYCGVQLCSILVPVALVPDLHHVFSLAEAVPKRILDLMNVEGLTRENVASHLQVNNSPVCRSCREAG